MKPYLRAPLCLALGLALAPVAVARPADFLTVKKDGDHVFADGVMRR